MRNIEKHLHGATDVSGGGLGAEIAQRISEKSVGPSAPHMFHTLIAQYRPPDSLRTYFLRNLKCFYHFIYVFIGPPGGMDYYNAKGPRAPWKELGKLKLGEPYSNWPQRGGTPADSWLAPGGRRKTHCSATFHINLHGLVASMAPNPVKKHYPSKASQ